MNYFLKNTLPQTILFFGLVLFSLFMINEGPEIIKFCGLAGLIVSIIAQFKVLQEYKEHLQMKEQQRIDKLPLNTEQKELILVAKKAISDYSILRWYHDRTVSNKYIDAKIKFYNNLINDIKLNNY